MLCVHDVQDVGVTKQLCDVTMKDANDSFLGAMMTFQLKMLFSCFLAEIILILYF